MMIPTEWTHSAYFNSYSYDITHSLQINMAPPHHITSLTPDKYTNRVDYSERQSVHRVNKSDDDLKTKREYPSTLKRDSWNPSEGNSKPSPDDLFPSESESTSSTMKPILYGIRTQPNLRFVWNSHLLNKVEEELHPDWLLFIMHGFIGQSNVSGLEYC